MALKVPSMSAGVTLPARISYVRSGDTANWSNVPSSRSRAMDWPVTDSTDSAAIVTIRAGIVNQR